MKITIDTKKKEILIPASVAKEAYEFNLQNERLGREGVTIQEFVNFDSILAELKDYEFAEMRTKK